MVRGARRAGSRVIGSLRSEGGMNRAAPNFSSVQLFARLCSKGFLAKIRTARRLRSLTLITEWNRPGFQNWRFLPRPRSAAAREPSSRASKLRAAGARLLKVPAETARAQTALKPYTLHSECPQKEGRLHSPRNACGMPFRNSPSVAWPTRRASWHEVGNGSGAG